MKELRPEQLSQQLERQPLQNIYLLAGQEPLLVLEAAAQVRQAAQQQGFADRDVFHADAKFDWQQLLDAGASLSLFSSRKIVELHLPENGPGREGSKALISYLDNPNPDTLLLVIASNVASKVRKNAWYKKLAQAGTALFAWPVSREQLPRWIQTRAQQKGLQLTSDASQYLAELTEGHLLACAQEIDRLALLHNGQQVDAATLAQSTSDQARFDMFDVPEKALNGDAAGAIKSLERLWQEGVDDVPILWALAHETRLLYRAALATQKGQVDAMLRKVFLPPKRKQQIKRAAARADIAHLQQLIALAGEADRILKGAQTGRGRDILTHLTLGLAGQPTRQPTIKLN